MDSAAATNPPVKTLPRYLRETVAIVFWLCVITKLFFYDFDIALIVRYPWLWAVLKYRFVFLLPVIAVVLASLSNKSLRRSFLYVACYPVIVLFKRVMWPAVKNWPTLVVFAPGLYSILRTLKWRVMINSVAVLAAFSILVFSHPVMMKASISALFSYLALQSVERVWHAFKPKNIFTNSGPFIDRMWQRTIERFQSKDLVAMRELDSESEEFRSQHIKNLKELYTTNLLWTYVAKKLEGVIASHRIDLYFVLGVLYFSILTLTIFALNYLALYKIEPSSFKTIGTPSFWTFLAFSFNAVLRSNFTTVTPVSASALVFANLELLAGVFIAFIIVSVVLKRNRERYTHDIRSAILRLNNAADQIANFIDVEFQMSMSEAEKHLMKEDPEFSNTLMIFGK